MSSGKIVCRVAEFSGYYPAKHPSLPTNPSRNTMSTHGRHHRTRAFCLAAASLVLRVVLFMLDKSDHKPLAKIASIAGAIGFLPLIVFEWADYLVMACVLAAVVVYCFR